MKLTTQVVIGFRSIGDSRDQGQIFEGTLQDAMAWLITEQLAKKSIARRFSIQIGRDRATVESALEIKGDATKRRNDVLLDLLKNLDDDSEDDQNEPTASGGVALDPDDDYIP